MNLKLVEKSPVEARYPLFTSIDAEERDAVANVLERGTLSGFIGAAGEGFYGGIEVQQLEQEWEDFFKIDHAISMNSATSGLYAAMGAIGIGPGDEVIVTPVSMSASATAPLIYGAQPVFADVSPDTYMLTAKSIEAVLSPRTKAVIVVNLFGQSADYRAIMKLADKHGLWVIEDNSQAPGARYQGNFAGTNAHIGVFSLNCHKHIQCGEGGICVTNDEGLAEKLQLIRNHAEAVLDSLSPELSEPLLGWNFRMTEISAAIARKQLRKLVKIISRKVESAHHLNEYLLDIDGIQGPLIEEKNSHVFYTFPIKIDESVFELSRHEFVQELQAQGIPVVERYVSPLYKLPLFEKSLANGLHTPHCPVAEDLYEHSLCYLPWCQYDFSRQDAETIGKTIQSLHRKYAGTRRTP